MIPGTVKSITVSGVYGQGDYDLSTGIWKYGATSTYVIEPKDAQVNAGVITPLTDKKSALMMIPQNFDANANANAKVSMVFNDGAKDKTVSFRLHGTSWEAGKHITYVLSSSKITTLKMGRLDYPSGWNSVNQIRKAYDDPYSSVDAGLFVVNEEKKVIAANVQLTYDGNSWSLPAGSKLKFSPKYNYFVYYPYQDNLAGLPVVNNTPISDVSISSSTQFFAGAIATWKSNNIAADQSTLKKMNDCDLQIGKASLDDDGCSVSFNMEHAMGLAVLNRESKSLDHFYKLQGYEDYTWSNGSVPTTANGIISSGQKLFSTTATQSIIVVAPNSTVKFTNTNTGKDEWNTKSVPIKINEGNKVYSSEAKLKLQHYDELIYKMAPGDIYYSDGAITNPKDISAARANGKTPIGVIGYLGNNKWTESGTGSGYGGHALVMCLKNIDSKSTTHMGAYYQWGSSNRNWQPTTVDTGDKIRGSSDKDYGSGYKETRVLVAKGSEAATAAKNYNTLPAPLSKCTGWFLPSAGQYYAVMSQLGGGISPDTWKIGTFLGNMLTVSENINAALSKVGADQYTEFFQGTNTWAWTSSEYTSQWAVAIDSGVDDWGISGSVRFDNENKESPKPVRPFLAF